MNKLRNSSVAICILIAATAFFSTNAGAQGVGTGICYCALSRDHRPCGTCPTGTSPGSVVGSPEGAAVQAISPLLYQLGEKLGCTLMGGCPDERARGSTVSPPPVQPSASMPSPRPQLDDDELRRQQVERQLQFQAEQQGLIGAMHPIGGEESLQARDLSGTRGGCTSFFGSGCNGQNPGPADSASLPAVDTHSDPEALSSAAKSSEEATRQSAESAKSEAGCMFSTAGCKEPDRIDYPKINGMPPLPAVAQLLAHIPKDALTDPKIGPQIRASVEWYQARELDKLRGQAELARIQNQLDGGSADTTILSARKQTLQNDLERIRIDQQAAEAQIRKALVDDSLRWDEAPASAAAVPQ